jgi:hypothetical protein
MNQQQVQQIIDTLHAAAGGGWDLLVRQQLVIATQELIWVVALVAFCLVLKPWPKKWVAAAGINTNEQIAAGIAGTLGYMAICGAALAAVILLVDGAGHALNPGGYAITMLLGK